MIHTSAAQTNWEIKMFIKFTNETDEQFAARKIARAAASEAFRAANQPTMHKIFKIVSDYCYQTRVYYIRSDSKESAVFFLRQKYPISCANSEFSAEMPQDHGYDFDF